MKYDLVAERRGPDLKIQAAQDAWLATKRFHRSRREHFLVLSLTAAHEVIALRIISIGSLNRCVVHPREVFSRAIQDGAAALIMAHNHPSGRTEPSPEDRDITRRLKEAGLILGIPVLDHLILTRTGWYSFAEQGEL